MNIIHPYGTVGALWHQYKKDDCVISFGDIKSLKTSDMTKISNKIKTFSETNIENKEKIQQICTNANKIIFLGFGYHKSNLELLFSDEKNDLIEKEIYGTGLGISDNDIKYLIREVKRISKCKNEPEIVDLSCKKFFDDFWYRLTF
jgi:hypothetical protein